MNLPNGIYYCDISDNYFNNNDNVTVINSLQKIKFGTGIYWKQYRLGDSLGGKYNKPLTTINEKWPNSIKDKYMKKTNFKANKVDVLFNIIKENEYYKYNTTNFLVVGIRIGDVLGGCTLINYVRPLSYYANIDYSKYIDKTVIIVCGSHYNGNTPKSIQYVISLYNLFKKKGFKKIIVRAGNSPDDDICFMAGSDYFIGGLGGFQKLAASLVRNFSKKTVVAINQNIVLPKHDETNTFNY